MKYKIEWIEVKTSAKGNKYAKASLKEGDEIKTDIAIFSSFPGFETLAPGSEVEGKITEKEFQGNKSYTLEVEQTAGGKRPNMDRIMDKKASLIGEAQEKKAISIHQAQERSAWMWAKYTAGDLVAHHPAFRNFTSEEQILKEVAQLATEIYNLEPERPF